MGSIGSRVPKYLPTRAAAASLTAHAASRRATARRNSGRNAAYQIIESAAAWKVPTTGCGAVVVAVSDTANCNGSCTCTRSKPRTAVRVRSATTGPSASGAVEPFTRRPNERPSAITGTPASPRSAPSVGPTTVASTSRPRSARPNASTWACTPPGVPSE
ncbi:MAG: hypothetical protein U0U69_15170 [Acidimicrobiia bacterium]